MTITVYKDGQHYTVKAEKGENLHAAIAGAGIEILAPCGGKGRCGKCLAKLLKSEFPVETDAEGKFLLCRCTVLGDMTVEVPENTGGGVTVFSALEACETDGETGFGIALDIGTTTLAAYLADLKSGRVLKEVSRLNPQQAMGADVLSRIQYCADGGLEKINRVIADAVNRIIADFRREFSVEKISRMTVAANTTMLHILAGVDPTPLGSVPFSVPFLKRREFSGGQLGIDCEKIILLPSVSAYVGGDITAGVLACDLTEVAEKNLFIDIGTNGEMALSCGEKLWCCSTAAGPAFEGANIACGMGGVTGAINRVWAEEGELRYSVLGGGKPKGFCGSGLVDLVAILVREGIVDESGAFCEEGAFASKLRDQTFYLTENVFLTQKDIRELQLAKSAICSGALTLLESGGIRAEGLSNVYIAGGFGFYLSAESAAGIGLLDPAFLGKIRQVGNTAGKGALACLLKEQNLKRCSDLAARMRLVELSANPRFMELYVENMFFNN